MIRVVAGAWRGAAQRRFYLGHEPIGERNRHRRGSCGRDLFAHLILAGRPCFFDSRAASSELISRLNPPNHQPRSIRGRVASVIRLRCAT